MPQDSLIELESALRAWFVRDCDPVGAEVDGLDIGWGGVQRWITSVLPLKTCRRHLDFACGYATFIAQLAWRFPNLKIVAAHFGGYKLFDEAEHSLAGKNLYFDTSWPPGLNVLDSDEVVRIIHKHGCDKILFGSDCPTADPAAEIQYIDSLKLSDAEKESILGKNAARLLDLEV